MVLVITILKGIRLVNIEREGLIGEKIGAVGSLVEERIDEIRILSVERVLILSTGIVVISSIPTVDSKPHVQIGAIDSSPVGKIVSQGTFGSEFAIAL